MPFCPCSTLFDWAKREGPRRHRRAPTPFSRAAWATRSLLPRAKSKCLTNPPVRPERSDSEVEWPVTPEGQRFAELLERAHTLMAEERFPQLAGPHSPVCGTNLKNVEPDGGFDAVIGNPPWDRIKLQQVEWFAARRPEIAPGPNAPQTASA